MIDDSLLTFRGPGPFHLPVVQHATAVGNINNGVTMILYAVLPGRGPEPESVAAQMVSSTARALAAKLLEAADAADAG